MPTSSALRAGAAGTLTAIREPGSVVRRGHSLYDVDGAPATWLLYGSLPVWRDFASGMTDGEDVRQLERNLRALGCDPDADMTVDDEWTWATSAAVRRFQDARGLTEDGTLGKGEVVFRPGASRVGEVSATVGGAVAPGAALAELSSTRREISVELEADRQDLVGTGDAVTVELPDGDTARGRVSEVGKVASRPSSEDEESTIDVTVALARPRRSRHRARPGPGRRRLRQRAAQGRARRAGDRAPGPQRRRVRRRGGRRRRAAKAGGVEPGM